MASWNGHGMLKLIIVLTECKSQKDFKKWKGRFWWLTFKRTLQVLITWWFKTRNQTNHDHQKITNNIKSSLEVSLRLKGKYAKWTQTDLQLKGWYPRAGQIGAIVAEQRLHHRVARWYEGTSYTFKKLNNELWHATISFNNITTCITSKLESPTITSEDHNRIIIY